MKELPTVPQPRTPIRTVKWSLLDMGFTVPGAIDLVPVEIDFGSTEGCIFRYSISKRSKSSSSISPRTTSRASPLLTKTTGGLPIRL